MVAKLQYRSKFPITILAIHGFWAQNPKMLCCGML